MNSYATHYCFWDKRGGWVQRLREFCDEKMLAGGGDFFVFNCGVSGDTAKDVIRRFDVETNARISDGEENVIIISIGSNDSEYITKKKKTQYTEKQFSRNIQMLINKARKYSDKIIFTGLIPVDQKKVKPIPWAPDRSYKNEYIRRFDSVIKNVCRENKIMFIELFEKFSKMNYSRLLEDGCHPNSKGHEIIYQIVLDFLLRNEGKMLHGKHE
jgi:lysophospholipase L1-like esterase